MCKLWLAPNGLHTDLNADGVLDHVIATSERLHTHAGHFNHAYMRPCSAYVYSGYPPKTALFNGTICRGRGAMSAMLSVTLDSLRDSTAPMEMATPIALPASTRSGNIYERAGGEIPALAVFLNSLGVLTAYDARGLRRWQHSTQAAWLNTVEEAPWQRVVPTLLPLAFSSHALPTGVLAAGAVILSCSLQYLLCTCSAYKIEGP